MVTPRSRASAWALPDTAHAAGAEADRVADDMSCPCPSSRNMPRVSVVLPSYNHERFVARALDSVLAQTYDDLEIVITDDGSTDNSVEVLRAYQEKDSRIKLFVNRVNYQTHSVNNCIRHSSGEYLAMLSSDDEFSPAKLATQVSF